MSRYARRVDANHPEIVAAFRAVGAAVIDLHSLGGALDCLVGFRGVIYLCEIKDGAKSPSRRQLTPAEQITIAAFRANGCPVIVAESIDAALRGIGAM